MLTYFYVRFNKANVGDVAELLLPILAVANLFTDLSSH